MKLKDILNEQDEIKCINCDATISKQTVDNQVADAKAHNYTKTDDDMKHLLCSDCLHDKKVSDGD